MMIPTQNITLFVGSLIKWIEDEGHSIKEACNILGVSSFEQITDFNEAFEILGRKWRKGRLVKYENKEVIK